MAGRLKDTKSEHELRKIGENEPLGPIEDIRERLFLTLDLLDDAAEPVVRADLASELVGFCSQYEDVKERVIYPALRSAGADASEIDKAESDQQAIRESLSEIRHRTQHVKPAYVHTEDPQGFEKTLMSLVEGIRAHVRHEDEMLLPLLNRLPPSASDDLRADVAAAVAHASTHPNPPHNPVARAIVAIQERLERGVKDESTTWHPGLDKLAAERSHEGNDDR